MASVKIVLRTKQNKDGSYRMALRITKKDRKTSYIYLGCSCLESDWDAEAQHVRKSHPNATRLNNFLMKRLAEANETRRWNWIRSKRMSPQAASSARSSLLPLECSSHGPIYTCNA